MLYASGKVGKLKERWLASLSGYEIAFLLGI